MSSFPTLWKESATREEILDLLTNDARRAIVREIYEAYDTGASGVPFSELYERVDCPDSGTFNYHLTGLQDVFIDRVESGYVPIVGRRRALQEILAWVEMDYEADGPVATDHACPRCDEPMVATYEDEGVYLSLSCDSHGGRPLVVRAQVPPRCVRERGLEEVVDLLPQFVRRRTDLILGGSCPICYARIDPEPVLIEGKRFSRITETESGQGRIGFLFHCERCEVYTHARLAAVALRHPEGELFLRERGMDPLTDPLVYLSPTAEASHLDTGTIASRDPTRLETTLAVDGDHRTFSIDGNATVVTVA
jgi:hypothetical protein